MNNRIHEILNEKAKYFTDISDYIWDNPELSYREFKSAKALKDAIVDLGFELVENLAGIETAFKGVYGSGHPVIGFMGEFDALAGLSQVAECTTETAINPGQPGHGCGHNSLGSACLAAAYAIKKVMEENNLPGTIIFYGCPAEEQGCGKSFMAREGVFNELDVAIAPHPGDANGITGNSALANIQAEFKFKGKASHAAAVPHLGRSALDACSLMIVGVQFLREHVIQEARIHHAYTNTGGTSPNVVQADASLLFYIRAPKSQQVRDMFARMQNIAQGAALMTDTTMEFAVKSGMTELVPNDVLGKVLEESFAEIGHINFSDEAMAVAKKMAVAVPGCDPENPLVDNLPTYKRVDMAMPGSTDVGDVSYVVPTVMVTYTSYVKGTPGHSWQQVAQTRSAIIHEGMIHNAKVMALAAYKLLTNTDLVAAAKKEFDDSGIKYECLIPADVQPEPQA